MFIQSTSANRRGTSWIAIVIAAIIGWTLLSGSVSAQQVARSVLVKVSKSAQRQMRIVPTKRGVATGLSDLDELNQRNGVTRMVPVFRNAGRFEGRHLSFGLDRWYKIEYTVWDREQDVIDRYRAKSAIEDAEPNIQRKLFRGVKSSSASSEAFLLLTPNDPSYGSQWQYDNTGQTGGTADADIDLPEAWALSSGNSAVVVSVLDSGADLNHPDLVANIWTNPGEIAGNGVDDDQNGFVDDIHGWDFSDDDNDPDDEDGHGSHTAGTIAASTNNGVGVAGIAGGYAGSGVQVMPLKIFENAFDDIIAEAFVYAADNGAVVSSNSWGGGDASSIIEDAIDYFIANAGSSNGPVQGGVVVFASGNEGSSDASIGYPASYTPVMAVAATDNQDRLPDWTNFGSWIDISAPGTDILSTTNNGGYATWDGTSMATPHVAGVAALVASYAPGLTASQLRGVLEQSADNIDALNPGFVGELGAGRLNAFNALATAEPPPPDETAPGSINDLQVSSVGSTSLTLEWTATGDDGDTGRASSYDLRMLASSGADPGSSAVIPGVISPSEAGTSETFAVTGLSPSTEYFFSIRAIDEASHEGPFSSVAGGSTTYAPSFTMTPGRIDVNLDSGATSTETVTLSNTGNSTITVDLSVADGTSRNEFSEVAAGGFFEQYQASTLRLRNPERVRVKQSKRSERGSKSPITRFGNGNVLVWDADALSGTGETIENLLLDLGYQADYTTSLDAAGDLSSYDAVFVSLGMFPGNHTLKRREGDELAAYLDDGGNLYMEGGDTWAWDAERSVHGYFGISGIDDGMNDLSSISGIAGSMTDGMELRYTTDFDYGDYVDRLSPNGSGEIVLTNPDEGYSVGIANDGGTYRTFGTSFSLGAASSDATTVRDLVDAIAAFLTAGVTGGNGPWLSITPETVTIPSGSSADVTFTIDASGMYDGTFAKRVTGHINGEEASLDEVVDVTLVVTGDGDGSTDPPPVPDAPSFPVFPVVHYSASNIGLDDGDLVETWSPSEGGPEASQSDPWSQPFFVISDPEGYPNVMFDGISHLEISNNEEMNTGGPYSEKTIAILIETGRDVNTRQVLFEEGGATRGLSIYIDEEQLYMSAWNRKRDNGQAPWGPISVSANIGTHSVYFLVFEFNASNGQISGRLNGSGIGSETGVGKLYRHTGRIGLGGMHNATRFHDGKAGGDGYGFDGLMSEMLYFDRVLTSGEMLSLEELMTTTFPGSPTSLSSYGRDTLSKSELQGDKTTPYTFSLGQNYPNPFNPTTQFEYQIPQAASVNVTIYNVLGQIVRVLVDRNQEQGNYTIQWDGRDNRGIPVASGTYMYRIMAGNHSKTLTMLMLK